MVPVEGVAQAYNFNWLLLPTRRKLSIELQYLSRVFPNPHWVVLGSPLASNGRVWCPSWARVQFPSPATPIRERTLHTGEVVGSIPYSANQQTNILILRRFLL